MKKINKNLLSLEITQLFSMAEKYFTQVGEKFEFYESLVSGKKNTIHDTINLTSVGNNNKILESNVEVIHCDPLEDSMYLTVEVNKKNQGNFKFKLKYNKFIPAPFFRFDSVGKTHRNKIDGVKMNDQQITPPHFHRFNKEGFEIAYKTEELKNEETAKALRDINFCLAHFCHESNTRVNEDEFPNIEVMPDTLGLQIFEDDPNQNVDFL